MAASSFRVAVEKQRQDRAHHDGNQQKENERQHDAHGRAADAARARKVPSEHGGNEGSERQASVAGNVKTASRGRDAEADDDRERCCEERNYQGSVGGKVE